MLPAVATSSPGAELPKLDSWFGSRDAIVVTDRGGSTVVARNPDLPLVPASTLKLLTALVAFEELGRDYRFQTEFYRSEDGDLTIKGYGDPLLISEEVERIAGRLSGELAAIGDLIVDDSFFAEPLTVPGVSDSSQPYDAPNGALCVNFNTVSFRRSGGGYVSGEPQTPLLPLVVNRVRSSGLRQGRIALSRENGQALRYAGAIFAHFLRSQGVTVAGAVREGAVVPSRDRLLYRHLSPFDMDAVVRRLLQFSNNFVANQLLLTAGAHRYGPPGDLRKGARAAEAFARERLGLTGVRIAEGSGISRENRISARQLEAVLRAFEPHAHLLQQRGGDAYKTGTLSGIRTRAGYLYSRSGAGYRYAILFNGSPRDPEQVVRYLQRHLP